MAEKRSAETPFVTRKVAQTNNESDNDSGETNAIPSVVPKDEVAGEVEQPETPVPVDNAPKAAVAKRNVFFPNVNGTSPEDIAFRNHINNIIHHPNFSEYNHLRRATNCYSVPNTNYRQPPGRQIPTSLFALSLSVGNQDVVENMHIIAYEEMNPLNKNNAKKNQLGAQQGQQAGAQQKPQAGAQQEPQAGAQQKHQAGAQQEQQAGAQQEPQAGAQQEPQAGAQQEPQAGAQQEPQAGAQQEPQAGAQQEPQAGAQQEPQAGAQQEQQAWPQKDQLAKAQQEPPIQRGPAFNRTTSIVPGARWQIYLTALDQIQNPPININPVPQNCESICQELNDMAYKAFEKVHLRKNNNETEKAKEPEKRPVITQSPEFNKKCLDNLTMYNVKSVMNILKKDEGFVKRLDQVPVLSILFGHFYFVVVAGAITIARGQVFQYDAETELYDVFLCDSGEFCRVSIESLRYIPREISTELGPPTMTCVKIKKCTCGVCSVMYHRNTDI